MKTGGELSIIPVKICSFQKVFAPLEQTTYKSPFTKFQNGFKNQSYVLTSWGILTNNTDLYLTTRIHFKSITIFKWLTQLKTTKGPNNVQYFKKYMILGLNNLNGQMILFDTSELQTES